MPLLEDSIVKISPAYSELATAIEATTHRLPTTGIIVPPPAELNQALIEAEETMDDILEAVGPQLGAVRHGVDRTQDTTRTTHDTTRHDTYALADVAPSSAERVLAVD
jgi:hypothetical protein